MVEMIVVVAMLSLTALIGLPRLFPETARVQGAVSELHAALQKAQRTAVLNQHDVRVLFDAEGGRLTVHLDRNNDGATGSGERVSTVVLPEGTGFGRGEVEALPWGGNAISFPDDQVTFHRDGSASSEGGVYLSSVEQLRSGDRPGETRALEVTRATGTVRCRRPSGPETWMASCQ